MSASRRKVWTASCAKPPSPILNLFYENLGWEKKLQLYPIFPEGASPFVRGMTLEVTC